MNKSLQDIGFKWFYSQDESLAIKGYFHWDEKLFVNKQMVDFFDRDVNTTDLAGTLKKIQGSFALIKETRDYIIAAVDRVRSFPLFYRIVDGRLNITDDVHKLLNKTDRLNEQAKLEFVLFSYVLGRNTLVENIKQLQAGEILIFDKTKQKLELVRYYEFKPFLSKSDLNEKALIQYLDELHEDVFRRLIESCRGRQIVIPLSGGYDSRLIALMLKRLNYDNVVCFSYGRKNNWESKISQEVAEKLGFKWIFCEHSRKDWYEYRRSKQYAEFQRIAGNLSSLACWQDFLAVKNLVEKNLIDCNAIVVPGHTYDFLQGNHLRSYGFAKTKYFESSDVFLSVMKKHVFFKVDDDSLVRKISDGVDSALGINHSGKILDLEEAYSMVESFNWQERQAKFICNSLRVYEFFGHEWRIPLWDRTLMDFWATISPELRFNRKLFRQCYTEKFPDLSSIPTNPSQGMIRNMIVHLKNPWYSQFSKSEKFFSVFTTKIADVIDKSIFDDFTFIPWHNPIIAIRPVNSIAVLAQLKEIYIDQL